MATVTIGTRTQVGFVVTIAASVGESVFELEFNRSEDFASDDSLVLTGRAAGSDTITGLPSDTVWCVRARKTNGGNGEWSPTARRATLPANPNGPYMGFSVDKALMVVPEKLNQISCATASAGAPVSNLLRDDPMSVMRIDAAGTHTIIFETSWRPVDTIALLGTLAGREAQWQIRAAASQAGLSAPTFTTGFVPFHASPNLGERKLYHGLSLLPSLRTEPWWAIDIQHTAPGFIARDLVVGQARRSVNASRGSSQSIYDQGSMNRTTFGTPQRVVGWRGRSLDFELSWLSEAEYQAKWSDLEMMLGLTTPVMVIPNSKQNQYLHDRIGFGAIRSTRSEVMRGDKHLRQITVDSLY